jgi:hypothetical protein
MFKVLGADKEENLDLLLDAFITHPNIEKKYGCCSVCHDMTIGKTKCSHHLCFICNDKIQTMSSKNSAFNRCPICRETLCSNNDD